MKIVEITNDGILFDNGARLKERKNTFVDWDFVKDATGYGVNRDKSIYELEFDEDLMNKLEYVNESWLHIIAKDGSKVGLYYYFGFDTPVLYLSYECPNKQLSEIKILSEETDEIRL